MGPGRARSGSTATTLTNLPDQSESAKIFQVPFSASCYDCAIIDVLRPTPLARGAAPLGAVAALEPVAGHRVDVFERQPSACGGWTERLRDRGPIQSRPFLPCQVQKDPELVAAFGTATPPSSDFLPGLG